MALPFGASARAVEPHRLLPERGCSTARCVAAPGGKRSVNAAAALDTAVRRPLIDVQQAHRQRSSLNDGAALDLNVLGRSYGAESFNERAQLERAYGMAFPQNAASHRKGMEHEWACDASRMALVPASTSSAPRRRRATGRLPRRHRAVPAAASDTSQSSGVSGESLRGREALHNIEAGVHGPCLGSGAPAMSTRSSGSTRVLTRAEEVALFAAIQRCTALGLPATGVTTQLPAGAAAHSLPPAEVGAMCDNAARAHALLLRCNARLVLNNAKRYASTGIALDDLLLEGLEGVRAAITRYDATRGFKFSTFAVWHIRQKLQQASVAHGRIVAVPRSIHDLRAKVRSTTARLERAGGGAAPTLEAIAAAVGVTPKSVQACEHHLRPLVDLEAPLSHGIDASDSPTCLLDVLASEHSAAATSDADAAGRQLQESLIAVLQTLQPRERNIVRLRYGLNAEARRVGRQEIAEAYGLSHERIRQIEDQAMTKLMAPWRRSFLREAGVHVLEQ